jgi:hypothetical protein
MSSLREQLQKYANRFMQENGVVTFTAMAVAKWAIDNKYWEPQRSTLIKQCAEEIAKALREEYITDRQGRRVRSKHVVVSQKNGHQIPLWADIRTAARNHMSVAFQQRRKRIVGDCRQLKTDVDSYNDNYNSGDPIQLIFDFTNDLQEAEVKI